MFKVQGSPSNVFNDMTYLGYILFTAVIFAFGDAHLARAQVPAEKVVVSYRASPSPTFRF